MTSGLPWIFPPDIIETSGASLVRALGIMCIHLYIYIYVYIICVYIYVFHIHINIYIYITLYSIHAYIIPHSYGNPGIWDQKIPICNLQVYFKPC